MIKNISITNQEAMSLITCMLIAGQESKMEFSDFAHLLTKIVSCLPEDLKAETKKLVEDMYAAAKEASHH